MNETGPADMMSGLDQLRAIFAGRTRSEVLVKTLGLRPVSAEEGLVVFEGSPTIAALRNPVGAERNWADRWPRGACPHLSYSTTPLPSETCS
jgi:hypothetical protein